MDELVPDLQDRNDRLLLEVCLWIWPPGSPNKPQATQAASAGRNN
jgi:hypothetical protein